MKWDRVFCTPLPSLPLFPNASPHLPWVEWFCFQLPQDFYVNYSQVWTPALPVTPPTPSVSLHRPPNSKATKSHMGHKMFHGMPWGGDRSLSPGLRGPYTANLHPPLDSGTNTPPRPTRWLSRPASTPLARTPLPVPCSRV